MMPTASEINRLNSDARCVNCGYDILGLPVGGVCPECGRALEESLRPHLFAFLSDKDARRLLLGINRLLLLLPLGATVFILLFSTVLAGGDGMVVITVIAVTLLGLVWILGWNAVAGVRVAGTGSFVVRAGIGVCILGVLLPFYAAFFDIPSARVALLLLGVGAASFTAMGVVGGSRLNKIVRHAGDAEQHVVVSASCFGGATALFLLMGVWPFDDEFAGVLGVAGGLAWVAGVAWLLSFLFPLQRAIGKRCDLSPEPASRAHR